MEHKYISPADIVQPKGRLIVNHNQHLLGAVVDLRQKVIEFYGSEQLIPNSDGRPFSNHFNIQRLLDGSDPDDCVTCAHQNAIYGVLKAQGVDLPLQSRRFTALDSGTEPNSGNSNWNVEESILSQGMVAETDCPSILTSISAFYQKLDPTLKTKDDFKKYYDVEFVPLMVGSTGEAQPVDVEYALSVSSFLVVSVDGRYVLNNAGEVTRSQIWDSHDVCLVFGKSEFENYNVVVDSENPKGFVKFEPNYSFHYPTMVMVKKKHQPMLYKLNGQPAIYYKVWNQDLLVAFGDGVETGGDHFKSLYGITNYDQLPVQHVNSLPYPVATYVDTTK